MASDSTMPAADVSVVIPLYNKGPYIERTLRSVMDQTVPCREIIVVDDGSTDGGPRLVEHTEDRRIRLLRQENQGPSAARNRGIAEARGETIAFLDADDEWKPWFLEIIVNLQTRHAEAGMYATAYEIREPEGHVYVPSYGEIPPPPWEGIIPNYFRSAVRRNPVWTSAVAIRREVFNHVGRFVARPGVGEDTELWGRIALCYPIAFSWRVGAVYDRGTEHRYCERVFTHVFASDCFEHALQGITVPPHLLPDVKEFIAREKLTAASRYILSGQSSRGRSVLRHCRTHRFRKQKLWWWFWSWLPHGLVSLAWRGKRWFRRNLRLWQQRLRRGQAPRGVEPSIVPDLGRHCSKDRSS